MKYKLLVLFMLCAACLFWESCGSLEFVPVEQSGSASSAGSLNMQSYQSLHFIVYGNDLNRNMKVAEKAEEIYKKIMFDTNLLSFKPRENYKITIYENSEEYQQRTRFPAWSAGGATTKPLGQILPGDRDLRARTSITTFQTVLSGSLLAHELTHLVFNEFMTFETYDDMALVLWLNEGLATYEEMEFYDDALQKDFIQISRSLVKREVLPVNDMIAFRPMQTLPQTMGKYYFKNQSYEYTNVDLWYWHVRFLTEFLIRREGQYSFYLLMDALKQKKKLADALQVAYPGKWRNLTELESEWRQWL